MSTKLEEKKQDAPETRESSPKNEAASVDWAEKLKASMNQSHEETPVETPEYDDLAALLRAQLNQSIPESAEDEDQVASDFEIIGEFFEELSKFDDGFADNDGIDSDNSEEYEEYDIESEDEEERVNDPLGQMDEPTEDFENDIVTYIDPDEENDEDESEIEECVGDDAELVEETFNFEAESDASELESENDIRNEISDSIFPEEYADITAPLQIEEPAPESLARPPLVTSSPKPYRRPSVHAWTDDRLNGAPTLQGTGNDRLLDLARENQILIRASEEQTNDAARDGWDSGELFSADGRSFAERAGGGERGACNRNRSTVLPRAHAPLQLGLDDISPTAQAAHRVSEPVEPPADTAPPRSNHARTADYTQGMAHTREEETTLGDTELFMDLGYVDVFRRTDEQSRVEQLRVEADKRRREPTFETMLLPSDEEYGGREDTPRVVDAYLRARRKNTARLVIAVIGALVGLAYDFLPLLLSLFGQSLDDLLGTSLSEVSLSDQLYYVPVGLLWTLVITLPFIPCLIRGIRSLINFEPNRYTVPAVAIPSTLAGGGVAWYVGDPDKLPLFCGAALLTLAISALAELLITEGEYRGFSVVSVGKTAHILTDDPTFSATALENLCKENTEEKEIRGQRIFSVVRAERVADYFGRTQRFNPYMGRLNYLLPIALLVSVACAGFELALGGEILTDGVRVFLTAYLLCLPAAYLVAMTLPLCRANTHLRKKGTAVIGAAAPADYTAEDPVHLIFSDGDALKALYRMDISLRGDPRAGEYRRIAAVVFRVLNIPLADDPILREERLDHYRIEISERGDQYMRLYLVDTEKDSATEIIMGSHNALTRRGIRLPRISMEKRYKKSKGSHVMYLAINRNFHLAYGVEYRVGRTFGRTVAALNELGFEVDISTYDPMFDPAMDGLSRMRKHSRVEILYPENFDGIRKARSSGVVATGRSLDLLHPLQACRVMLAAYRRAFLYSWICLPVVAAAVISAVLLGLTGLMTSALAAAWQLMGLLITLWITLASTKSLTGREKGKDKTESKKKTKKKRSPSARR